MSVETAEATLNRPSDSFDAKPWLHGAKRAGQFDAVSKTASTWSSYQQTEAVGCLGVWLKAAGANHDNTRKPPVADCDNFLR